MEFRWLGAILIIAGCGGCGFSLAARYRQQERTLSNLIRALERMECELQYRLTPLPDLCRMASEDTSGLLRKIFLSFARELEQRAMPDAASCMRSAIVCLTADIQTTPTSLMYPHVTTRTYCVLIVLRETRTIRLPMSLVILP